MPLLLLNSIEPHWLSLYRQINLFSTEEGQSYRFGKYILGWTMTKRVVWTFSLDLTGFNALLHILIRFGWNISFTRPFQIWHIITRMQIKIQPNTVCIQTFHCFRVNALKLQSTLSHFPVRNGARWARSHCLRSGLISIDKMCGD